MGPFGKRGKPAKWQSPQTVTTSGRRSFCGFSGASSRLRAYGPRAPPAASPQLAAGPSAWLAPGRHPWLQNAAGDRRFRRSASCNGSDTARRWAPTFRADNRSPPTRAAFSASRQTHRARGAAKAASAFPSRGSGQAWAAVRRERVRHRSSRAAPPWQMSQPAPALRSVARASTVKRLRDSAASVMESAATERLTTLWLASGP